MADMEVLAPGGHQHLVGKIEEQLAMKADAAMADAVDKVARNQVTREVEGELMQASDAYGAPMLSLGVDGKSTQAGTPTPEAPVEIVSVENPVLTFAGRNLFDPSLFESFPQVTYADDVWTIATPLSGMNNKTIWRNTGLSGTGYIWYQVKDATGTSAGLRIYIRYKDGSSARIGTSSAVLDWTAYGSAYIDLSTVDYLYTTYNSSHVTQFRGLQIVLDSIFHNYEPYQGHTVTLPATLRSLPDGAKDTLALTYLRPSTREGWAWYSRTLVQRVAQYVFSDFSWVRGSRNWDDTGYVYRSTTHRSTTARIDSVLSTVAAFVAHAITSWGWESLPVNTLGMYVGDGNGGYPIFCADYANASDLVAAIGNEILLLPLATPITTTLDPIELPILPAPNVTVWADPTTGLQMEYVRDTELVIDSLYAEIDRAHAAIAPVEHGTSSANYAVGSYLMLDGTFCKVTSAIATGETIAIGTNVVATTVDAELASLA